MQADHLEFAQHIKFMAATHTLSHYAQLQVYKADVMDFLRQTLRPQSMAQLIEDVLQDLEPERTFRVVGPRTRH